MSDLPRQQCKHRHVPRRSLRAQPSGRSKIFNTDQGAQYTADAFTACLLAADIQVSMDGRGRALDNAFCERLWRRVKYENIYLNQYDTVRQLQAGLSAYFDFYNHEGPHQSPDYRTPAEEHFVLCPEPAAFAGMRPVFPFSWSNDWGSPYSSQCCSLLLQNSFQQIQPPQAVVLKGTDIHNATSRNNQRRLLKF